MKEMHNIILILIPSRWFNSFVWSLFIISYSRFQVVHLGFRSSKLFQLYHFKAPSNSSQALNLFFSSFTSHAFITGVLMVVHHVLIHPRSLHQDSCWSSSILHHAFQLQSFLPYLFRWCYVILDNSFMFHDSRVVRNEIFKTIIFPCSGDPFNPSIYPLELSWVIFHLKLSPRILLFMVLINDPSSSFIIPMN